MSKSEVNLYSFDDYREYLNQAFPTVGEGRGLRSKLAEYLNCQSAFISQVLQSKSDLSMEHAILVSNFLKHDENQKDFFLLLVSSQKSGSSTLKEYYQKKIQQERDLKNNIANRIKIRETINLEEQQTYYSSWYYAALHILVSIPPYQTLAAMAQFLKVEPDFLTPLLQFLEQAGLITFKNKRYEMGAKRLHLGKDSPLLKTHHTNWRLQAIKAIETPGKKNMHYSAILGLSETAFKQIEQVLLKSLEESEDILRKAPEELICALNIDFFKL